jgi:hypothetical protein
MIKEDKPFRWDRALSDDELRQATEPLLRDRINDAITQELLRQIGPAVELIDTGQGICIPGNAVQGDTIIDVDLIVDAVLPVITPGWEKRDA